MIGLRGGNAARAASARKRFDDDIEMLRLRIAAAIQASGARVGALLGVNRGVGTTTLAVALAESLARESRRTLLIDGNVANPALHDLFETDAEPGAVDLLEGRATPNQVIRDTSDPNLSVVPSGLLRASSISTTVEYWRNQWRELAIDRFLLIDAGGADSPSALTMAAASDAAILVVRCGDSRREQVEAIQRGLSVSGTKVLGVILNQRRYVLPTSIYRRL